MNYMVKKPPIVRLPPKSNLETMIGHASRVSLLVVGLVAFIFALKYGRPILLPVTMAVVIGLMIGPGADRLERAGMPSPIAAFLVVFGFVVMIAVVVIGFAVPLSEWAGRLPIIWRKVQEIVYDWRGVVETVTTISEQFKNLTGDEKQIQVTVDEGGPAMSIAILAPGLIGQLAVFLGSLFFFISARHHIRASVLRICISRRLRWRTAHIFRDVETQVSRYLVTITTINACLGLAVSLAMLAIGVPSPFLWGMLAGALNYIIYIGPAMMALILLGVGLATFGTLSGVIMPPLVYLLLNFVEAQFITPHMLGRQLTINPFVVFLALVFWLWVWGPAGGFVAVPLLLMVLITIEHILPLMPVKPER